MKPYAQDLYKIQFGWVYPASLVIFKEGKRLIVRNPQTAAKLQEKLGLNPRNLED